LLASDEAELVLLDFGCSQELDEERRHGWIRLARAIVSKDVADMAQRMEELGFVADSASREGLEGYARMVVEDFALVRERGGDWPNQVEMLAQFASLARRIEDDPITTLPGEAVMLGRVFGTLAGLFLHYRPDTSAATSVLPILLFALSRTPIEA
jgi:ubiquinone biosynthesis protein